MNNETQRKITSLTLMTIMLAGGMVIAAPGMEPAFAANPNLFVSAENSDYSNYMSGPQVIEVVVIDSDIDETTDAKGEPIVTINRNELRMVQATDGNWYGYFADAKQAIVADDTTQVPGQGLDFGIMCSIDSIQDIIGVETSQARGIAISNATGISVDPTGKCTFDPNAANYGISVLNTAFTGGVDEVIEVIAVPAVDAVDAIIAVPAIDAVDAIIAVPAVDAVAPEFATNEITVNTVSVGDTITIIGGQVFTATTGTTDANNFAIDTTLPATTATNLVNAINTNTQDVVTATSAGDTITLTADTVGVAGNSIVIVTSNTVSFTITSNAFTGGVDEVIAEAAIDAVDAIIAVPAIDAVDAIIAVPAIDAVPPVAPVAATNELTVKKVLAGDTITIDGEIFTATTGTTDANNFAIDTTSPTTTATNLVTAINTNTIVSVTATSAGDTITLTADTVGVVGDNITAASSNNVAGVVMNVLRETKQVNPFINNGGVGQIGLNANHWPFIQLFDFSAGGNVEVQYNKGGGSQSTTLTFDTVDQFAKLDLDGSIYTQNAQVHATITDLWLNIDPTDADSWTFGTNSDLGLTTNYQVFDENGKVAGAGVVGGIIDISDKLSLLMIEKNGVLIMDPDAQNSNQPVLMLQDNDNSVLECSIAQDITTCGVISTASNGVVDVVGLRVNSQPITFTESGPSTGVFEIYDDADESVIKITDKAKRGTSATLDYNQSPKSILAGFSTATIDMQASDSEWNSGELISVTITDGDANKNSRSDEDLDLFNPLVSLIPSLTTGDPFTIGESGVGDDTKAKAVYVKSIILFVDNTETLAVTSDNSNNATIKVDKFSERAIITPGSTTATNATNALVIDYETTAKELKSTLLQNSDTSIHGFNFLNIDVRSFDTSGKYNVFLVNATAGNAIIGDDGLLNTVTSLQIATNVNAQKFIQLTDTIVDVIFRYEDSANIGIVIEAVTQTDVITTGQHAIVVDFFSYGFINDGLEGKERIANQIIRIEAEETGDNTGIFTGSLEYKMINQINILDKSTYAGLSTIADNPTFIVIEDLTDEDSPRVNYLDLGADGVDKQVSDQEEAPSHSGVVSFDNTSYKNADTVTITLEDLDLNVDSDLIEIYTTVSNAGDANRDTIGSGNATSGGTSIELTSGKQLGRLLDVTFNDKKWTAANSCNLDSGIYSGLADTGFTLVETGTSTGIFTGSFQIPTLWCSPDNSLTPESATGLDIEVNYIDFRDASGEIIEVGDSAGIRANTGSVSLDRTVYPVPFGVVADFDVDGVNETPSGRSLFPIHQSGMNTQGSGDRAKQGLQSGEFLANGDLNIHIRVNDPDFDISASGEDKINSNSTAGVGPVKISVIRGSSAIILGYAGGPTELAGTIDTDKTVLKSVRQFGPMVEIAPDAGIFEVDIILRYTDGPASTSCPSTEKYTNISEGTGTSVTDRFDTAADSGENYCILQGDILQVEYTDPADASGDINTVTDSATFDLRNGVLQTDKSVYIIGSDMILTLIEPDLDLDNDQAETYDLDLIEWDSDAATLSMGDADGQGDAFDPEPLNFRETGDSTGIFQIVIEMPAELSGNGLERGEEINLEYTDWGPSGANYVGNEDEDVNVTIFTSNFGATVELDQKVYTWTDKVYITIVAPDHNFDGDLIDEIGNSGRDPIKVSTRGHNLDDYKLVETGTDTGIFTGEVILTGFTHDADGDTTTGPDGNDVVFVAANGNGPTSGFLPADDDDGLTVSFEFSEDETVVGSALIRWNIGEAQWLEASYPASGTGVVRVIDPDMNLDPEAVDNFSVDVWSDSDAGGIDLTVTETNEATGIYEGTVFFTTTDESSGHRLRVAEGDTVTAEYEDNTLPDPYTTADELDITATTLIGTLVPPLERAPAANLRVVDAFGNSLNTVSVDQQVQITADLSNGQDRDQGFAYLVQIQDGDGVTVSLAWITGSLSTGQSFSPALSWIPTNSGSYTATAFVWESVDNPTALSPPVSTTIDVS